MAVALGRAGSREHPYVPPFPAVTARASPCCALGEGNFTFVTVIHLIEFQLGGIGDRGSGGMGGQG